MAADYQRDRAADRERQARLERQREAERSEFMEIFRARAFGHGAPAAPTPAPVYPPYPPPAGPAGMDVDLDDLQPASQPAETFFSHFEDTLVDD